MNSRTTWTLVALAVGLFAGLYFFERHFGRHGPTGPVRVLPDLNPAAVTSLQVLPAGQLEIRAERTNDHWRLVHSLEQTAQDSAVNALVAALAQLRTGTRLSAEELRRHPAAEKEFGFENPRCTIILQQGAENHRVQIGGQTPYGDELFLRVVGGEGIYVVDAQLLRLLPRHAGDWREATVLPLDLATVDHVTVTNGANVLELQREGANAVWQIVRPLPARADNPRLGELLDRLKNARVEEFVTDDPKADLDGFGLQPAGWTLTLAKGTNQLFALGLGRSPTNAPGLLFARRSGTDTVTLIARESIDAWRAKYEDFRDHHLVPITSLGVERVEAKGAGEFTLERQTNDLWHVTEPDHFPADIVLMHDFLGALARMRVVQFVKDLVTEQDLAGYGLTPPAREIVLRASAQGAPATNRILATLDFGATNENRVFVRRSDAGAIDRDSVFAVPLDAMKDLPTADWQLRDRRLWNFSVKDVTRLTIRQHGRIMQLIRDGDNAWRIAPGSQGIINDLAVEGTVQRLGELTAVFWTARGDADRARYGFTENSHQISLDLKTGDKPQTVSVEFGGVAPSQFPYAAVTLEGSLWIFEFPLDVYQLVQNHLSLPASP